MAKGGKGKWNYEIDLETLKNSRGISFPLGFFVSSGLAELASTDSTVTIARSGEGVSTSLLSTFLLASCLKVQAFCNVDLGTSLISLIPLAPLSLVGFYIWPTKSLTFSRGPKGCHVTMWKTVGKWTDWHAKWIRGGLSCVLEFGRRPCSNIP